MSSKTLFVSISKEILTQFGLPVNDGEVTFYCTTERIIECYGKYAKDVKFSYKQLDDMANVVFIYNGLGLQGLDLPQFDYKLIRDGNDNSARCLGLVVGPDPDKGYVHYVKSIIDHFNNNSRSYAGGVLSDEAAGHFGLDYSEVKFLEENFKAGFLEMLQFRFDVENEYAEDATRLRLQLDQMEQEQNGGIAVEGLLEGLLAENDRLSADRDNDPEIVRLRETVRELSEVNVTLALENEELRGELERIRNENEALKVCISTNGYNH